MLTDLGRLLRKIRIDHGEILKDMANRFGVTASYLSAVENGKRAVPEAWEEIIGYGVRTCDCRYCLLV